MPRRSGRLSLFACAALGLLMGCPEDDGPDYKTTTGPILFVSIERPAASYEQGTTFELRLRYGHKSSTVGYEVGVKSVALKIFGGALELAPPEPSLPRTDVAKQRLSDTVETTARFTCARKGKNQRISVTAIGYESDVPTYVTVEVFTECLGGADPEPEKESWALPALEFAGDSYFGPQFVELPNGDTYVWQPEADVPPLSIDGQSSPPSPDPSLGYGTVGDVPETIAVVNRTQLQTFCDAYKAALPSALSTSMLATCDALLVDGGGGGGGTLRGDIVDPCLALTEAEASGILGNPVTRTSGANGGYQIACSFDPVAPSDTAPTFNGSYILYRVDRDPTSMRDYVLGNGYANPEDASEWVVLNDSGGVFADDIAAGSVIDPGGVTVPISQGTPDPALGDPALMFRNNMSADGDVFIVTALGRYDLFLLAWSSASPPWDPPPGYVPAAIGPITDIAYELIHPAYPYVLGQQPQ